MSRLATPVLVALVCAPLAARAQSAPPPTDAAPELQPNVVPASQPAGASSDQPPPPAPPEPSEPAGAQRNSDFMDTRLNFTCTNEDMLRDSNVLPTAPGFHCGRPNALGILFFDNYDTRFTGFETLTNLALYKHFDFGHWDFEGGLVIRVNEFSEDTIRLADGGSYIRAAFWFDETRKEKERLSLVAFPVSSDRMRLGYSYRISWGGSPEFFKPNPDVPGSSGKNPESVPGAKLQYDASNWYAYAGIKSSLLLNPVTNEKEGVLAFLGGAGIDINDWVRVEANGGVFDRGKNETAGALGKPVVLYGASEQIVIHQGIPVGSSIDYALYRNEPTSIARLFAKEKYPGGLSWLISQEATVIFQTLKDAKNTNSTATQMGFAGDLNFRLKYDYTRLRIDFMVRDLAYILHSVPSTPTYSEFPEAYGTSNEFFVAIGVDQFFPSWGVTTGVTIGADKPATLTSPTAEGIPGNLSTSATQVVRNESTFSVLPEGEDVAVTWAVKGTARKDFGDHFAAIFDLYYQYDPNTVKYERSSAQGSFVVAKFAGFNQLGFDITLQARF